MYRKTKDVNKEIRGHWLGATEVRRGLHKFNVLVQVLRKAVVGRADEHIAIVSMLPTMELLRKYKGQGKREKGKKD